jgi:hypothetical protein
MLNKYTNKFINTISMRAFYDCQDSPHCFDSDTLLFQKGYSGSLTLLSSNTDKAGRMAGSIVLSVAASE